MSNDATRRKSVSSTTSPKSDDHFVACTPARIPFEPRQSSVSMFTGRVDIPTSPATSHKSDGLGSALSPGTIDRVFPIRSAVSIDPTANPSTRHESSDGVPGLRLSKDSDIARPTGASHENRTSSCSPPGQSPPLDSRIPQPRRKSTSRNNLGRSSDERGIVSKASNTNIQRVNTQALSSMLSDGASVNSDHNSQSTIPSRASKAPSVSAEDGLVTDRFKHIVTDSGHAIITGRGGETLQRCEDEPIHAPGAIQSFGLLIAFKEEAGKLVVRTVSENSKSIIGYTPAQLFALDSFVDIFSEEQADNLLDHLDFIRDEDAVDVTANGPEVFMISIRPLHHRTRKLWCAMHVLDSDRDMVICEFELEDDQVNPLVPSDNQTPELPEDTLGSNPTDEELAESTVNASKPLRVLRSARKRRGEAAAMDVFNIMSQVQEQMANAPTLQVFLKVLTGVVKELSGFHRVMIYQFDQGWNGRVVAELVDPRSAKDLYNGLNFPASDIPKQARDMYKINKVRLLYDRSQETSRLVCRTMEDLEKPLDMTHAYLRAMSPIHVKYLANMAVRASMSISITAFNELWGLVACHSYGAKGMRVSFPIRKMCRLVGDFASRNIERLSYASRLQARKLINTASSATNPSGYIVASSEDLLNLFDADAGVLSIRDETKIMGPPQRDLQELLAMVEYLRLRKLNAVTTSQDIQTDFPDLRYAPGLKNLAGFLYVPLSNGGSDFIAFFRKGVLQEVKWAGNPYEKFVQEGTEGYLEPRKSFKTWSEMIVGRCREWTEEEVETASVLCLVYGKFIEVWRQKEAALQNSQLTRLLLANSAHEVRTPLNHIINYLEIALEGSLDNETRDNLAKSHSASKSLVYVINDLLDLTKTEGGQALVKEDPFNLLSTLREAVGTFSGDAKRKGIEYTVSIAESIPSRVIGDPRRVRQVISNLIANAVQHTTQGSVSVAVCSLAESTIERCEIEIVVEDTGAGMSHQKVDALFRELEEVSYEIEMSEQKILEQDSFTDLKADERQTLGLGLAVVARTVRTMNGQLRLKTEEGKGSRFVIQLGFDVERVGGSMIEASQPSASTTPSPMKETAPSAVEGEVTLIDRNVQKRPDSAPQMIRRDSVDSMSSLTSLKSVRSGRSGKSGKSGKSATSMRSNTSQKSDADRLIDAIQEPLRFTEDEAQDRPKSRSKRLPLYSRGSFRDISPTAPQKANGAGFTRDLKSAMSRIPGQEKVTDSKIPMKAVKVSEDGMEKSSVRPHTGGKVVFQEPSRITLSPSGSSDRASSSENFSVLVAEDDPINSKIMKKRLEKLGHFAYMTINGEECSSTHGEQAASFDAILMDLQMPIVDGFSSTKMIRSFEKTRSDSCLSDRASQNGRIPIFAVSASLIEKEREKYIATGFDGWILKPVDFKRVNMLLRGIVDEDIRNQCVYEPGKWEQGGWFAKKEDQHDMYDVRTDPSQERPTIEGEKMTSEGRNVNGVSPSEGSITPTQQPADMANEPTK